VGVTEADIRDLRYEVNRDVVIVRLWNWRKFYITGLDMTTHEHNQSTNRSRNTHNRKAMQ
jgi:hypothetical protein